MNPRGIRGTRGLGRPSTWIRIGIAGLVASVVASFLPAGAAMATPAHPAPDRGVATSASPPLTAASTPPSGGYWLVARDGGVFGFGDAAFHGSTGGLHLNQPIVGMASTPDGGGYWLVASDGGIFAFGDAGFFGSTGGLHLDQPIVGMASTPDGGGYWLVASDGGIFAFGDAGFFGSLGAVHLNQPIVGMASTPDGGGYWLVARDGGVFALGDAAFDGSTGGVHLDQPIVGMAATPDGGGYWLVASDGGIFAYGDAGFFGSTGGMRLSRPIVGMTPTSDGAGYNLTAADGGVFSFGDSHFYGSTGADHLSQPIVGTVAPPPPADLQSTAVQQGATTMYLRDGGELVVQPGTLPAGTRIVADYGVTPVAKRTDSTPFPGTLRLSTVPFTRFTTPMTLEFPLDPAVAADSAGYGLYSIATLDPSTHTWTPVSYSYDPSTHMLVTAITHFSFWSQVVRVYDDTKNVVNDAKVLAQCAVDNGAKPLSFLQCLVQKNFAGLAGKAITDALDAMLPSGCWGDLVKAGIENRLWGSTAAAVFAIFKAAFITTDSCTGQADTGTMPNPVVTGVSPSSGPAAGGNTVTISGDYLDLVASVTFGGRAAPNITVVPGDHQITATAPAGSAGTVDVIVSNGANAPTSSPSSGDKYTYVASSTPVSGSPGGTSPPPPTLSAGGAVAIGWSSAHPSWIAMTLSGFAPGSYTYTCNFASGGDASYSVGISSNPETFDNGATCYDTVPGDKVWVTIDGVTSNTLTVAGSTSSPPPPPPPPPGGSIAISWSAGHPSWIAMTVAGFAAGSYTYSCDFGSGGDASYTVGISSSPETFDNGQTCYDTIAGDTVWVTIDGVTSNTLTVGGSAPAPPPAQTWAETAGGVTHTWTDYADAGGTEGTSIGSGQTVQVACKVPGFRVADGDTWWYRIASSPWSGAYYASADAFYNNGQTSGSLQGTPFVDPNVASC